MTTIEAVSEMSAVRRAVWFSAVLFAATPLAYTQVTWTPIYVGGYSEYNCYSLLLVQSDDNETERKVIAQTTSGERESVLHDNLYEGLIVSINEPRLAESSQTSTINGASAFCTAIEKRDIKVK
ncbi:hypothetical protein ALC60_11473 [Trachymyrmex zeteki]|uniref:Uncharacterized protein n=1 Tax=Mycetomoellerius zeteki TaxID=64791 RepID=A0A151WNH9_9HYME|nr:hypothetical protein ALC60_11473 [Trachymyrmex zeteki]